jgi:hypothetical protein
MPLALGVTAIGGLTSAAGTLAGGSMAAAGGAATQQAMTNEAATAFASGQRKALDTTQRSNLLQSTSTARAAASGVNAGVGSPAINVGNIAKRGSYESLMDMFNGQSQHDSLLYQGQLADWEGKEKQDASYLSAAGTLAGSAGSMLSTYGGFKYPNTYGRPSAGF